MDQSVCGSFLDLYSVENWAALIAYSISFSLSTFEGWRILVKPDNSCVTYVLFEWNECVYLLAPSFRSVIVRNVFFKDSGRQQTFFFCCHDKVMNLKFYVVTSFNSLTYLSSLTSSL